MGATPGGAGQALTDPLILGEAGEAHSVANGIRLGKQLASEAQVAEIISGEGAPLAGAGARVPIRDVARLTNQYGGSASDWAKIRSWNYKAADGASFETHAYKNVRTGEVVELKTKFQ